MLPDVCKTRNLQYKNSRGHMDNQTLINDFENKIHIDASVKIGNYDMKFKATGYRSEHNSLFSVIIYDRLYELTGNPNGPAYQWQFTTENLLPEDLATVIGKEIEKHVLSSVAVAS
jgi:hypothetical protein